MRRVPETSHRRFRTLRRGTQELLEQGEQLNIEFKSEVPSNLANQAAAGANLVALDPSIEVYTILIGVEEQVTPNGARRGCVVGNRDADGNPLDLDKLRLQISQMIRDRVVPPPQLAIYEENTGTPRPILVLEIRPNEPPHRVADKYQVRGVGGLQPLTQQDALAIFRSQRVQAWIDELESSNPLIAVLQGLLHGYEELSFRVSDAARDDSVDLDGELETIQSMLRSVLEASDGIREEVDSIWHEVQSLHERPQPDTPEGIWRTVRQRRELVWLKFNHSAGLDRYTDEEVRLIELVVRDHLGGEPGIVEFPANFAELQGYNVGFELDTPDEREAPIQIVRAAIARAIGVPLPLSSDWIAEGIAAREELREDVRVIREGVSGRVPRLRRGRYSYELGVAELNQTGIDLLASHEFASSVSNARAIIWRSNEGRLVCARSPNSQVLAMLYQPTWGSDAPRRGLPSTAELKRKLGTVFEQHGGHGLMVDGEARVLPLRRD